MKAKKQRRGSFLKIRKGRGKGAKYYIEDSYKKLPEVLHEGIETSRRRTGC
jgi:hypothetical protein